MLHLTRESHIQVSRYYCDSRGLLVLNYIYCCVISSVTELSQLQAMFSTSVSV